VRREHFEYDGTFDSVKGAFMMMNTNMGESIDRSDMMRVIKMNLMRILSVVLTVSMRRI
jgi:hypothetical protein